jgi:hypothetical protein
MAALQLLQAQGYAKVSNSRGGMQAWLAERQPLEAAVGAGGFRCHSTPAGARIPGTA